MEDEIDFEVHGGPAGGEWRVHARGELDLASVALLEEAFDAARASAATRIIVDLSDLTFIDSTGLAVLLEMSRRCGPDRLVIWSADALDRLASLTGVRDRMPLTARPGPLP